MSLSLDSEMALRRHRGPLTASCADPSYWRSAFEGYHPSRRKKYSMELAEHARRVLQAKGVRVGAIAYSTADEDEDDMDFNDPEPIASRPAKRPARPLKKKAHPAPSDAEVAAVIQRVLDKHRDEQAKARALAIDMAEERRAERAARAAAPAPTPRSHTVSGRYGSLTIDWPEPDEHEREMAAIESRRVNPFVVPPPTTREFLADSCGVPRSLLPHLTNNSLLNVLPAWDALQRTPRR